MFNDDLIDSARRARAVEQAQVTPLMTESEGGHERLVPTLKHKRRNAMLKKMLMENGYGELAHMISIHDEGGNYGGLGRNFT